MPPVRLWAGEPLPGLWAAAFWATLCSDLHLQANQPNTEVFINACLIWAFVLLVRAHTYAREVGRFLIIGLLFALASLYKPVVAVTVITLSFIHLATAGEPQERRRAAAQVVLIGAVGLVFWAGTCAYFYVAGRFAPFYETSIRLQSILCGGLPEETSCAC